MSHDTSRPIQGLRLSTADRQRFLDDLEQRGALSRQSGENRRSLRVPFNVESVVVTLRHANGQTVRFAVPPRNISAGGLAIIHGQFVYPDTRCEVVLPMRAQRTAVRVTGKVVRCDHIKGVVHEVSIVFDEPIALEDFVPLTEAQRQAALREYERHARETTDAPPLRVLIVDDSEPQLKLISLWLEQYGAQTAAAHNTAECFAVIEADAFNMIVLDLMLGDESGIELCAELRRRAFNGPIIAVSACDDADTQASALAAGCDVFLPKPLEESALIQLVDEIHTHTEYDNQPLHSALAGDLDMQPLIADFVGGLSETVQRLLDAVDAQDALTARKVCVQLKGDGGTYGFTMLSELADKVLAALRHEPVNFDAIAQAADALAKASRRAVAA